jgi:hypothetical protein
MAKVAINSGKLHVSLTLFQVIRALQPSFDIPLSKIRGATEDTNYIRSGLGIRAPGTGFPGVVAEGTFYKAGQRTLSLWRKGQEVVVLELEGSKWDRVLLGCDDSKELSTQINQAINK